MFRKVLLEESMELLQWEGGIDVEPEIHEQIKQKLYSFYLKRFIQDILTEVKKPS